MAEVPVQAIVDALAAALRSIAISAGYNTDLGAHVHTERLQVAIPVEPRCTVLVVRKARTEGANVRPDGGRTVTGVIEIVVPVSYADAMGHVYAAEEDVDRLLRAYHQMPQALPVQYVDTVFLDTPEGLPVVVAQIEWTTGYRR